MVGGRETGHLSTPSPQGQYCDICTAAHSNRAHPVSNAIDGTERWWQSPPLSRGLHYNEVNVTLDLGQVGPLFCPRNPHRCSCGWRTHRGAPGEPWGPGGWGWAQVAAGRRPLADGGVGVGAFCVFVNIPAALREGGGGRGLTRGHGVRGQLGGGPGVYSEEFLCLEPGSGWRLWEEALEVDIPGIAALQ